jgi:hypothetical protein
MSSKPLFKKTTSTTEMDTRGVKYRLGSDDSIVMDKEKNMKAQKALLFINSLGGGAHSTSSSTSGGAGGGVDGSVASNNSNNNNGGGVMNSSATPASKNTSTGQRALDFIQSLDKKPKLTSTTSSLYSNQRRVSFNEKKKRKKEKKKKDLKKEKRLKKKCFELKTKKLK